MNIKKNKNQITHTKDSKNNQRVHLLNENIEANVIAIKHSKPKNKFKIKNAKFNYVNKTTKNNHNIFLSNGKWGNLKNKKEEEYLKI